MHLLSFVATAFAGGSLSVLSAAPWFGASAILVAPFGASLATAVAGAAVAYKWNEAPSNLAERTERLLMVEARHR